MKKIVFLLAIFFVTSLFSQNRGIKMKKIDSQKEVFIKENKRVRVKTIDGLKFTGRFKVVDELNISIKDNIISLKKIVKINKKPLLLSVIVDGALILYGGVLVVVGGLVGAFLADSLVMLAVVPGAGLIYLGIKSPNLLKSYRVTKKWKYYLITD